MNDDVRIEFIFECNIRLLSDKVTDMCYDQMSMRLEISGHEIRRLYARNISGHEIRRLYARNISGLEVRMLRAGKISGLKTRRLTLVMYSEL